MKKLLIVLLLLKLTSYNIYGQQIKRGVLNHPILGKVKLQKTAKDEDGYYFYVGKGTYKHKKNGKVDFEIAFYDDYSFLSWIDVYQDSIYGKVTIERGSSQIIKTYTGKDNRKIVRTIRHQHRDSIKPIEIYTHIDNIKEGKAYSYHRNGVLKSEETYKSGDKIGPYKKFHDNGQLSEQGTYTINGNIEGKFSSFRKNGELIAEGDYLNKKRIGKWKIIQQEKHNYLEIHTKCTYNKDSVYCEDREIRVHKGKNELLSIRIYKKANTKEYDIIGYDGYEKFDQINHGPYKEFQNKMVSLEGSYNNDYKIGNWKAYYDNGNLKSDTYYTSTGLEHGTWNYYDEYAKLERTNKYYKGERVEQIELNTGSIIGGIVFFIAILLLLFFNKKLLKLNPKHNNQLKLNGVILSTCVLLLYITSIAFLENIFHSIFNIDYGWSEAVSTIGLCLLLTLTVLISLKEKPSKKRVLFGFLGFILVWSFAGILGFTGNELLLNLIGLVFPIYEKGPVISAIALSTACFSGIVFIYKYWKINIKVNYFYLFIISLLVNLIIAIILTHPEIDSLLSHNVEYFIIITLNYLICAVVFSINAENNSKYTQKIKSSLLAFIAYILVFSILLSIYKYIDPFKTDCEKVLEMENYLEDISDKLETDAKQLNDDYSKKYKFNLRVTLREVTKKHKKELEDFDNKMKTHLPDQREINNLTKEVKNGDCSLLLEQHQKLKKFSIQRADLLFDFYKKEIDTKYEEKRKNTPKK